MWNKQEASLDKNSLACYEKLLEDTQTSHETQKLKIELIVLL